MKRENVKKMLAEMSDREFRINEIADVFKHISSYLTEKFESSRMEENDEYRRVHRASLRFRTNELERILKIYRLDYTLEEIEEEPY